MRRASYRPRVDYLEDRTLPSIVTNLGDSGLGSLRNAIATTADQGTVTFNPGLNGTITLTSGALTIAKNLTITGPATNGITVSGNNAQQVFGIGAGITVSISNLTIAAGQISGTGAQGAGLVNRGNLTLSNATVQDNMTIGMVSLGGGGIANLGTMTLISSTVSNNVAISRNLMDPTRAGGGGIFNSGTLTIDRSTISGNRAARGDEIAGGVAFGGGIDNRGTLTLLRSTVSNNTAANGGLSNGGGFGGGLYNGPGATMTLTNATLSGNTSSGDSTNSGGGGAFNAGTMTVTSSTINGNSAANANGGGLSNLQQLTVTGSAIFGNSAGMFGGGLFNSASLTLSNSTIVTNSVGGQGGGLYTSQTLTPTNCTFTGNNALTGGGIGTQGGVTVTLVNDLVAGNTASNGPDLFGAFAGPNNLVGTGIGNAGLLDGQNANQIGPRNGQPIDPKLGPLQDNGGPTQTEALLPGSLALDAGTNAGAPGTDQRGFHRPVNGRSDIGAYESQTPRNAFFAVGGAPGRVQIHKTSDGTLVSDFTPFGGTYTGAVTIAWGDLNGDNIPDLVVGAAVGNPQVKIYNGATIVNGSFSASNPDASLVAGFFAFGLNFNVGVNVAVGDVNNDGVADLILGANVGNPHVKVYNGQAFVKGTFNNANPDASLLTSFFAYGLQFNVGVNVAAGDVNRDGFADIVTGATVGNPHVKVYSGAAIANGTFSTSIPDASLLTSFFAYGQQFNVGANVAVGDVNGDGFADIITGASAGNPHVKVFDGKAIANGTFSASSPDTSVLDMFFAYNSQFNVGVTVGATDFDADGKVDIITGASRGAPHYRVVDGLTATGTQPASLKGIEGIPSDFQGGIFVGA